MSKITLADIDMALGQAIQTKMIYNVDYVMFKDIVSRDLDRANRVAHDVYVSNLDRENGVYKYGNKPLDEVYGMLMYPHLMPKFRRLVEQTKPQNEVEKTVLDAFRAIVDQFGPVCDKLVAVKAFVVKGRKPSTEPRKTPERTIDNTGTCQICGQNVKRTENGALYDHGFNVKHHYRSGQCFGTHHQPVEVSPRGMEDFLVVIKTQRANTIEGLSKLRVADEIRVEAGREWKGSAFVPKYRTVKRDEPDFQYLLNDEIRQVEWMIETMGKDIKVFTKRIAEWAPRPLPDGNRDHMEAK